jgi:hypothetical protein
LAAFGATVFIEIQRNASLAYPTTLPGWITGHYRMCGNVFSNDGACSNHCIFPDINAAKKCCIGPDAGPLPDRCFFKFVFPFNETAGIDHIGKNSRRAEKDIVFNNNSLVDGYIVLNLYPVTDYRIAIDINVLANIAIPAHFATGHQVTKMPDPGSITYFCGFIDK